MKPLITLMLFFSTSVVFANSEWGRQICEQNNGRISTVELRFSAVKKIEICTLGQSVIELNTLDYSRFNPYGGPEANRAYRATQQYDFNSCERHFGRNQQGRDIATQRPISICEFQDRSWIGTNTLNDGTNSVWNRELNRVLGIF